MENWQVLEEWLEANPDRALAFTNVLLASELGLTRYEGSWLIQDYLTEQRKLKSRTLYVLHRTGRTRGAVWSADVRSAAVRARTRQFADDVKRTIKRAVVPDLTRIAAINPRAARLAEARVDAIVNGALVMLANAVDAGDLIDEDE